MYFSFRIFIPSAKVTSLILATAIAMVYLAPNFTITSAQQLPNSQQSSITQSPTLLNSKDSFRVKLPEGWVIQDINNTGFTLAAEALEGYGLLAELCPHQQEQSALSSTSVTGSSTTTTTTTPSTTTANRYTGSCQHAREVIHIVRYPNLGAWLGIPSDEEIFNTIKNWSSIPNAVLAYHLQKLQQVGYQNFTIVNSADTAINIDNSTTTLSQSSTRMATTTTTTTTIPAKLIEMTYSTRLDPNEIRRGYFLLTATAATPRNLGTLTGYSIFYEGNFTSGTTAPSTITNAAGDQITRTSSSSSSSSIRSPSTSSVSLPTPVRQVFDSFELVSQSTAEPLSVEITPGETEGIAPATFDFEADVSGGLEPYTIRWDFGDGSIGSQEEGEEQEPDENDDNTIEHTFDLAGIYNVRVSVTDSTGRTASDSISIIVDEPPPLTAVNIISNATVGIAPATFGFKANVTGGVEPYAYRWNFGDGSIETDDDEHMAHTFDLAGIYNVSIIITDSTGRTVADKMPIIVDEPPPPRPLRLIEIIPSDTEGIAPATFGFKANVTGGVEPYAYRWNFGDGSKESTNDETIEHTFDLAGIYNVTVTVIDSKGRTADDSVSISVEPPLPPLQSVNIISNATVGIAPATFGFKANVTGGVEPYAYRWNFGDGSKESNKQTVTHTFNQTGRHVVRLIVTDSQNQVALDRIAITVEEAEPPTGTTTLEGDPTSANQGNNTRLRSAI
jgi:PKD repeat protein